MDKKLHTERKVELSICHCNVHDIFVSPWIEGHFTLQMSCHFIVSRDRFRTMINVLGDSLGAGIVDHLSKSELLKLGQPNSDADRVDPQNGKLNAEEVEWHTTAM
jgi:hypothetical protein